MARKADLARRGRLAGPSVVERPEAALFFGIPNALFGLAYYPLVALAYPLAGAPVIHTLLTAIAFFALAVSLRLGFALWHIPGGCRLCWTAHLVNLALAVLVGVTWII
jgi:uncharacterized membrane protein